ncbi:hypothetical protein DSO57_1015607 [Entomophthora muscae]|uniref:Uncharacterized protein n=1 Tax=Entomophthora muscae TaxID=34485 RepID=A0ACC2SI28_9FUNG|nr:hypothetical protein DSO57_1015607 [Entomophthora muscae]
MLPLEFNKSSQVEPKSLAHFSFTWEKLFIRSRSLAIKSELASKFKCLHLAVARKGIKLRKEFNVLNNIGFKRDIVDLFLQIEPVWLTLAFEVVLGRKGAFAVCFEEEQTKELLDEALFGHVEYGASIEMPQKSDSWRSCCGC